MIKTLTKSIITLLIAVAAIQVQAQEAYVHLSHSDIYDYLDEMANEGFIELNSSIKPYSRSFIAKKLTEAYEHYDEMNSRQQDTYDFYMRDYGKEKLLFPGTDYYFKDFLNRKKSPGERIKRHDMFFYQDSNFTFTVNPILGGDFQANANGNYYHRWNGAEAFGYIGKNLGSYVGLRDNYYSKELNTYSFLIQDRGIVPKRNQDGSREFEQIYGGITYNWKWGSVGIIKDHLSWGDNNHGSNILSDRAPSFAQINLKLTPVKWFELNYFHGWLVSGLIDSSRTYTTSSGSERTVMYEKYMAANMFTFKPFKSLYLSMGNSVVYSDIGIHPGYLIPVMFFKAVDHSINGKSNQTGQNSQLFFNVSSRQINKLHLYSSLFVDEIALSRMWEDTSHTNFVSWKAGFQLSNLVDNFSLTAEYTRTNPITYKHFISTTTYASNYFNMGHYLKDNAHELFLRLRYTPAVRWFITVDYLLAEKGPEYEYINEFDLIKGLDFMEETNWVQRSISAEVRYEIMHDMFARLKYEYSNIDGEYIDFYTPEYKQGKNHTLYFGFNLGF